MKKIVFPFIVALLMFFISCEKEKSNHYYMDEELRSYIPFDGGEKLHYVVNDTQKTVLTAQPPIVSTQIAEGMWTSDPTNYYEEVRVSMVDSSKQEIFLIRASSLPDNYGIYIYHKPDYEQLKYHLGLVLNYTGFFNLNNQHGDSFQDGYNFMEKYKMKGKTYFDVMQDGIPPQIMLYNKSDGIIFMNKVETVGYDEELKQDTISYELEKIEWN